MNAAPEVVTRQVVLELVGPQGAVPAQAELRYDALDPYAVSVTILQGNAPVTWVFGRDLLIRGLSEPVGEGDVHVSPALGRGGRAVVVLLLRAPGGQAVVHIPAQEVIGFLARTAVAVWPGTEGERLSTDDAIAALLVGD